MGDTEKKHVKRVKKGAKKKSKKQTDTYDKHVITVHLEDNVKEHLGLLELMIGPSVKLLTAGELSKYLETDANSIRATSMNHDVHAELEEITESNKEQQVAIVYDVLQKYGTSYYLVINTETVALLKLRHGLTEDAARQTAEEHEAAEHENETLTKWASLGSSLEIATEFITENRPLIKVMFAKPLQACGLKCSFAYDMSVELNSVSVPSDDSARNHAEHLDMVHLSDNWCQATVQLSNMSLQTWGPRTVNASTQYEHQTMSEEEMQMELHSERLKQFMADAALKVEQILLENITENNVV